MVASPLPLAKNRQPLTIRRKSREHRAAVKLMNLPPRGRFIDTQRLHPRNADRNPPTVWGKAGMKGRVQAILSGSGQRQLFFFLPIPEGDLAVSRRRGESFAIG